MPGCGTQLRTTKRRPSCKPTEHNASKCKCLLVLMYSQTAKQQKGWLTARQLHLLTGISYGSILASLPKWVKWRILERRKALLNNGDTVYSYSAVRKGIRWFFRHQWRMPMDRYLAEMFNATGRRQDILRLVNLIEKRLPALSPSFSSVGYSRSRTVTCI